MRFVIPFVPWSCVVLGQLNLPVPLEEKRDVMHLRQIETGCRFTLMGEARVGQRTAAGGKIHARALGGEKLLAVRGTIRYFAGNGLFHEARWRSEVLGVTGVIETTIIPDPVTFPAGLPRIARAEMRLDGAYFESGRSCGTEGPAAEAAWRRSLTHALADVEEAIRLSEAMDETSFAKRLSAGLLAIGPYARPTSEVMNSMLRAELLLSPRLLHRNYKDKLRVLRRAIEASAKGHA